MERERYVKLLQGAYRRYYNIVPASDLEQSCEGLLCRCDFDVRNAQYILTKKNELWSAESHEYCYMFSVPVLTADIYRKMEQYVYTEGMKLVHPGKGHMCTTLTMIVVCDQSEADAEKHLKRCRIHKNFRFSLDGWMDFHTGLMNLQTGKAMTNFSGHDNARVLRQILKANRDQRVQGEAPKEGHI